MFKELIQTSFSFPDMYEHIDFRHLSFLPEELFSDVAIWKNASIFLIYLVGVEWYNKKDLHQKLYLTVSDHVLLTCIRKISKSTIFLHGDTRKSLACQVHVVVMNQ
ncbi:hypothetical protein A3Q36_09690 [Geobacillus stearothermophilus]|nr:hypothetical protein A3Q36_09690 [Geobacillus stearothermophilus]